MKKSLFSREQIAHALRMADGRALSVRRGITLAERAVLSSNTDRRIWFGRSAYKPGVLGKVLDNFRTNFNHCEVSQDRKTPMVRLRQKTSSTSPQSRLRAAGRPGVFP